MARRERSRTLFDRASRVIPGGVNSPARAFGAVGGNPLFIERGEGSRVFDADGNSYIDYVCSWGPLIMGHAYRPIIEAVRERALRGTSYGAPTEVEIELAERVCKMVPSVEMVRMVNSGTEATMSAVRLARGYSGRRKILKFEGCWHGHADSFLMKAGSSALTTGAPDSPGVTEGTAQDTLTVPFNDLEAAERVVTQNRDDLAAVIVEPVAGNMGVIPPLAGFLEGLRTLTQDAGAILIFDEVITGFRVSPGGAQALYRIEPDLTTLGKIIGGGVPVGAFGGRREIMSHISPLGMKVSQAGTLSGNPLAMSAGLAMLDALSTPGIYDRLESLSSRLELGLKRNSEALGAGLHINRVGSMMTLFFRPGPVHHYGDALSCDTSAFGRYFWSMMDQGIYVAPSQFEAMFVSSAHTESDVDLTIEAHRRAITAALR